MTAKDPISDEKLNELADWFLKSRMGTVLDITFATYLDHQDYYDELFDAVKDGAALHRTPDGRQEIVGEHGIMQRVDAGRARHNNQTMTKGQALVAFLDNVMGC